MKFLGYSSYLFVHPSINPSIHSFLHSFIHLLAIYLALIHNKRQFYVVSIEIQILHRVFPFVLPLFLPSFLSLGPECSKREWMIYSSTPHPPIINLNNDNTISNEWIQLEFLGNFILYRVCGSYKDCYYEQH